MKAASHPGCLLLSFLMISLASASNTPPLLASVNLWTGMEIVKGPYLQYPSIQEGAMAVVWETSLPARGAVIWGETGGDVRHIRSESAGTRHLVMLDGLDPRKTYRYRVEAGGRFSRQYSFRPFPGGKKRFKFIVYGDSRWNHAAHESLVEEMKRHESDFLIHNGDMVTHGSSLDEWDLFFFIVRPLAARMPVFPVAGNHEYFLGGITAFLSFFSPPENSPNPKLDYFFDTANSRFIVLDTRSVGKKKNGQKPWFEKVMRSARDRKLAHLFVFFHQGIQSSGPHGPDRRLEAEGYLDLMRAYGVTLVVGGHDHIYERGVFSDLRYIVTGGGGAPIHRVGNAAMGSEITAPEYHFILFNVKEENVEFKVLRPGGTLIEECSLEGKGFRCVK